MASGGKRPGAGRKKGVPSRKTVERAAIVDRALLEGITPLEVMLRAMRQALADGNIVAAAGFAQDCAPYVHPRLSSTSLDAKLKADMVVNVVTGIPDEHKA